jgi:hypothetical protein
MVGLKWLRGGRGGKGLIHVLNAKLLREGTGKGGGGGRGRSSRSCMDSGRAAGLGGPTAITCCKARGYPVMPMRRILPSSLSRCSAGRVSLRMTSTEGANSGSCTYNRAVRRRRVVGGRRSTSRRSGGAEARLLGFAVRHASLRRGSRARTGI